MELVPDEQLERLYPQLVALVGKLKGGESCKRRIDAIRGTVLNPMTRNEIVRKCRDLMDPFLGAMQAVSSSMQFLISNCSITSGPYDDCCSEASDKKI
jgi:2-methylcitrate dehydratase PrpD